MGRRIPLALVLVLFVGVAACSDDSTETGATSETVGTEVASESTPPATDDSATAESTTTVPDLSVTPGPEDWDPILITVQAGEAPPAATCPEGTDPNTPGSVDQDRPMSVGVSNRQAAFDRHLGRIMFVDWANETWTFDVCTNTWMNMNPQPATEASAVVYDVDSDVTVGFENDRIWVYDAGANNWTEQDVPTSDPTLDWPWGDVIYDPLSGLILSQTGDDPQTGNEALTLMAYDVDTNTWTEVGTVEEPSSFVGYSEELDKLVRYQILSNYGDLLDPRTGDIKPSPPTPDFGGAYGLIDYAADTDTPYVGIAEGEGICGLDPDTLGWQPCFDPDDGPVPRPLSGWSAIVGDSINNRLILINSQTGLADPGGRDDVWAIDLDTGEWTEILAPSTS
jgi:hypothetical protein